MKIIEMLKTDSKKIKSLSKLNWTLNKIETRLFIIKKQNVNQLIKTKMYTNVIKTITKITKNENERKKVVEKITTTSIIKAKREKKLILKVKSEFEKKKLRIIFDVEFFKRIKKITKIFKNETIELKWLFSDDLMIILTSTAIKKKRKKEKKKKRKKRIKTVKKLIKILKNSTVILTSDISTTK